MCNSKFNRIHQLKMIRKREAQERNNITLSETNQLLDSMCNPLKEELKATLKINNKKRLSKVETTNYWKAKLRAIDLTLDSMLENNVGREETIIIITPETSITEVATNRIIINQMLMMKDSKPSKIKKMVR